MIKKILILILFFYILALFQTSFFVHFTIAGMVPNLILMTVILINLFEKPEEKRGLISAFFGGFFLDIFSENFVGFWILISIVITIFIKFILKKYVGIPIIKPR